MSKFEIIEGMPEAKYHADPCVIPSLSASIVKVLLNKTPMHAKAAHPRLNPTFEVDDDPKYDRGKSAHSLILRDPRDFVIVDAKDWRTKDAKEARADAYARGETPLLTHQWKEINAMVASAREQLKDHEDASDAFVGGKSEVTVLAEVKGVWCRIRIDHVPERPGYFYDYKTTETLANPDTIDRLMYSMGWDITAAFYRRVIKEAYGIEDAMYKFVVQEVQEPYAIVVIGVPPSALDMADRKVDLAFKKWSECMRSGVWPGYPKKTCYVSMPKYHESAWLERELREEEA